MSFFDFNFYSKLILDLEAETKRQELQNKS